ncbi:MAG TPA: DUF1540 domain-containing protein [Firmicutes bacterium]|nr:DUF1540 domain-containing protein [Bacillota bacterium]
MAQHVYCTVNNCHYWDTDNVCLAKEILVTVDRIGATYPESLDANNMMEVSAEIGVTPADTCMSTCCKTFYDKSKGGSGTVPKMSRSEYEQYKKMKA